MLYTLLDLKYSQLHSKISAAFEQCEEESAIAKQGFQAYLARLNFLM